MCTVKRKPLCIVHLRYVLQDAGKGKRKINIYTVANIEDNLQSCQPITAIGCFFFFFIQERPRIALGRYSRGGLQQRYKYIFICTTYLFFRKLVPVCYTLRKKRISEHARPGSVFTDFEFVIITLRKIKRCL